jgi:hypothetical protein
MNGHDQETRGSERHIPKERQQHIMMLLARMIHQQVAASHPDSTEGAARKRREQTGHLRASRRRSM